MGGLLCIAHIVNLIHYIDDHRYSLRNERVFFCSIVGYLYSYNEYFYLFLPISDKM